MPGGMASASCRLCAGEWAGARAAAAAAATPAATAARAAWNSGGRCFRASPRAPCPTSHFGAAHGLSDASAVRWTISVASPSTKNPFRRLCCRAEESKGAAERRLSDRFGEIASDSGEAGFRETSSRSLSSPPSPSERSMPVNLVAGVGIAAAVLMMAVLGFVAKPRTNGGGSVSDLIRRGQLRSDRGGKESKNLLYDDPFNNPLVKTGSKNPIVKMCGKMFRLTPVTLTNEKVAEHQNRRIQAYKWKRPSVFLSEGDPVPEGVDTEEVRWIPSNHPFATTSNFIDEEMAQKNVYQTKGVPSRVRAEHEALRRKILETAQREQEFQLPSMENSGAQAWAPSGGGRGSDPTKPIGKQVNGSGGNRSGSEISHDGSSNPSASQS